MVGWIDLVRLWAGMFDQKHNGTRWMFHLSILGSMLTDITFSHTYMYGIFLWKKIGFGPKSKKSRQEISIVEFQTV